jgi:hypothetical protein
LEATGLEVCFVFFAILLTAFLFEIALISKAVIIIVDSVFRKYGESLGDFWGKTGI